MTFAFRAAEETGRELAEVVRAYAVAGQVFDLEVRSAAVEALAGQVPAQVQALLRQQHQRLLDRAVRWLLHARPEGIDVPAEVDRFAPAMRDLAAEIAASREAFVGLAVTEIASLRARLGDRGCG